MTNTTDMAQQIVSLSDQLSNRSQWTLFIMMFILWLAVTGFAVRYMVAKLNQSNEKLIASEIEKSGIVRDLSNDRFKQADTYSSRLEGIVKELTDAANKMTETTNRMAAAIDKLSDKLPLKS